MKGPAQMDHYFSAVGTPAGEYMAVAGSPSALKNATQQIDDLAQSPVGAQQAASTADLASEDVAATAAASARAANVTEAGVLASPNAEGAIAQAEAYPRAAIAAGSLAGVAPTDIAAGVTAGGGILGTALQNSNNNSTKSQAAVQSTTAATLAAIDGTPAAAKRSGTPPAAKRGGTAPAAAHEPPTAATGGTPAVAVAKGRTAGAAKKRRPSAAAAHETSAIAAMGETAAAVKGSGSPAEGVAAPPTTATAMDRTPPIARGGTATAIKRGGATAAAAAGAGASATYKTPSAATDGSRAAAISGAPTATRGGVPAVATDGGAPSIATDETPTPATYGSRAAVRKNVTAETAAETAAEAAAEEKEEEWGGQQNGARQHLTFASECIDGAQAPLCDALTIELAQQLELIVEDNDYLLSAMEEELSHNTTAAVSAGTSVGALEGRIAAGAPDKRARMSTGSQTGEGKKNKKKTIPLELEIEGRLGVLLDIETGTRLALPFTSVALLSSSFCPPRPNAAGAQQEQRDYEGAGAPLRFDAGVNEEQFGTLMQLMIAATYEGATTTTSTNNNSSFNAEEKNKEKQKRLLQQEAAATQGSPPVHPDEADDENSDWEATYDEALQATAISSSANERETSKKTIDKKTSYSLLSKRSYDGSTNGSTDVDTGVTDSDKNTKCSRKNSSFDSASSDSHANDSTCSSSSSKVKGCKCVFCGDWERVSTTLEHLRAGQGWEALDIKETEEEYHEFPGMSGTRIRLSYEHPKQAGAEPLVALWKENLLQWNLYTGKDSGQEWLDEDAHWTSSSSRGGGGGGSSSRGDGRTRGGVRTVDCRVAINVEHHVDVSAAAAEVARKNSGQFLHASSSLWDERQKSDQKHLLRRIRKRQSFVHAAGLRVDLTEVYVSGGDGSRGAYRSTRAGNKFRRGGGGGRGAGDSQDEEDRLLYEVETEMHPQLLLQAVQHKKRTGDAVPLLVLCESFLFVLHGLAARLNTAAGIAAAGGQEHEQQQHTAGAAFSRDFPLSKSCLPSAEAAALYTEYLSPCLPLLGDYCFRAVAPALRRAKQPPLHTFLRQINPEEASCYTSDTVSLVGPWIPCVNEKGQLEFAPVTSTGVPQGTHERYEKMW